MLYARVNWVDTGRKSTMSILLQENGFGRRRYKTTGSLSPDKLSEHHRWHNYIYPWLNKLIDIKGYTSDGDIIVEPYNSKRSSTKVEKTKKEKSIKKQDNVISVNFKEKE